MAEECAYKGYLKYQTHEDAVQANRDRAKAYYHNNKEKSQKYSKDYYSRNREQILEKRKLAAIQTKELQQFYQRSLNFSNPEVWFTIPLPLPLNSDASNPQIQSLISSPI